jgi:hypothetical protein
MKCVLHIGTEKTGTTLLQDWLYLNQAALSESGIYLSNKLGKTNNRLIPAYFCSHLDDWARRNRIATQEDKHAFFEGFLENLTSEITQASKSHKYFVITSEHLHSRLRKRYEIEDLYKFLNKNFDGLKVICYFRNQFDVAVSLYSTALKISSHAALESFIEQAKPENYYYDYARIADTWAEVFGRANCDFKVYNREQFLDKDIRKDFIIAIDSALYIMDPKI